MSPTTVWDIRHTTATSHRPLRLSIVIDNDFQMTAPPFSHRAHSSSPTLLRPDGTAWSDVEVRVRQVRHAFAFGNLGFDFVDLAAGETGAAPHPGEERTLAVLDRFARFGLPLQLTETTLLSGDLMPPEIEDLNDYQPEYWPSTPEGEERQADEVVRHYRTLLSHRAVEAVNYWGITDRGAWLGAPAGLVRHDGSPKPAYDALHRLVKEEWWLSPTTLRTDAEGRVDVSGWLGDYVVECGGASAPFALESERTELDLTLR